MVIYCVANRKISKMKVSILLFIKVFFVLIQAKENQLAPGGAGEPQPRFLSAGSDVTAVEGRDVTLPCSVDTLGNHKVAWLRVDTQTILTIGPHVITKNHRVGVGRGDVHTWALTIRDTRPSDGGRYMCQVNTEPMITQTHFLDVLVPPDIVESGSGEVLVQEGEAVGLHCQATGRPAPVISWRREDFANIGTGGTTVTKWNGEWLNMTTVRREQGGAYLCIATNGVPPSVSKRIILLVLCKPSAWLLAKSIGGYLGESILLECRVESYPTPIVYWSHGDTARLKNGSKYQASITSQEYKHSATLTIRRLTRADVGSYYCHAENSLGTARDDVTVYTLSTTTMVHTSRATSPHAATIYTTIFKLNQTIYDGNMENNVEDGYAVVLSQHQMSSDVSPST